MKSQDGKYDFRIEGQRNDSSVEVIAQNEKGYEYRFIYGGRDSDGNIYDISPTENVKSSIGLNNDIAADIENAKDQFLESELSIAVDKTIEVEVALYRYDKSMDFKEYARSEYNEIPESFHNMSYEDISRMSFEELHVASNMPELDFDRDHVPDAGEYFTAVQIEGMSFHYDGHAVQSSVYIEEAAEKFSEKLGLEDHCSEIVMNEVERQFNNSPEKAGYDAELANVAQMLEEADVDVGYDYVHHQHYVETPEGRETFHNYDDALNAGLEALEARQEAMYDAIQSFEPSDPSNEMLTSIEFEEVMADRNIDARNPLESHSLDEVKAMSRDEVKVAMRHEPVQEVTVTRKEPETSQDKEKDKER